ncbi:MAG TPA: mechanosensitive ion channel family protein [Stellaceae bacterium]|nr:mechanosensitive ion channel family protein [Stellaceae bacterium]
MFFVHNSVLPRSLPRSKPLSILAKCAHDQLEVVFAKLAGILSMLDRQRMIVAAGRTAAIVLGAIVLASMLPHGAMSQGAPSSAAQTVPSRGKVPVARVKEVSALDYLNSGAEAIHDQIVTLAHAVPSLPDEFRQAAARFGMIDWAKTFFHLAIFGVFVFGFDWLFRTMARRHKRRLETAPLESVGDRLHVITAHFGLAFGVIAGFVVASIGPFLLLDWQPITRATVFGIMIAIVLVRVAIAVGDLLLAPNQEHRRVIPMDTAIARFWWRRVIAFAGWFAFFWVSLQEAITFGFSINGQQLVGYTLGLGAVGIALEAVWRRPVTRASSAETRRLGRTASNVLLSVAVALLWVLWVASPGVTSVHPAFWLVFVIVALPLSIIMSRRVVEYLYTPLGADQSSRTPGVVEISLEHGIRAVLIICAVAVLAWGWDVDLVHLADQDTLFSVIVHGVLTTAVVLLAADVLWQVVRASIDIRLSRAADPTQLDTVEGRQSARLHTLLPIFRNLSFVFIVAVAVMMALAGLGVQIGPLIAGASVVGVAIGFGAQTFVRDIIAGMFYLLDDAFRVGEYIQSGTYKGTVEGFSIRSIRLRHHRGPVYTVPFSLLGAIQNMSRDWVIDKLSVGVTYDTDLAKVKKIVKQIGKELGEDPEFKPKILETLKMQGVEQFGDYAIQIRMKMMTKPGEQFAIRRRAYAMIKQAFGENGVEFAFPTVQVAGGEAASAEIASAAQRVLTKPTEVKG